MKRLALITLAGLSLTAWACAESGDDTHGVYGADSGATAEAGGTTGPNGSGGGTDSGVLTHDGGAVSASIVINEISGKGDEWIELLNSGAAPVDLAGYGVTDREKEGGAPKPSDVVTFPSGTVLQPGAYLLVGTPHADAGADASACPAGAQAYCIESKFGISNKDGDSIFLMDQASTVIGQEAYPPNTVSTGQTWGRMPNASGPMGLNQPTPGSSNKGP